MMPNPGKKKILIKFYDIEATSFLILGFQSGEPLLVWQ